MVSKEKVNQIVHESLSKIPEDDQCDECLWLYQMILDGIEGQRRCLNLF